MTSSRKWQSFEERLRFRNQFPQWRLIRHSAPGSHIGVRKEYARDPCPVNPQKVTEKLLAFLSLFHNRYPQLIILLLFQEDGLSAAGCRVHPYSVKHSFWDYFLALQFILICRILLAGMISGHGFHPDLQNSSPRDDFRPRISS